MAEYVLIGRELQCYGILALKMLGDRSQSSYIASETVLSRNNAIARFKRMVSYDFVC